MRVEHEPGRAAFLAGLAAFVETVTALDDAQLLAASRCHGWTVCDVIVHVHQGLQEMLLGVVTLTDSAPDTDAAGYWRHPVPSNDPDADPLAGVRFTRLVAAAYRRPTGAVAHLLPTAAGVRAAVGALRAGVLRFQGHALSTGDFLATWSVELAVHHLDLGRELTLPAPATEALRLARGTVEALAGAALPREWSDELAVLAGTGRQPLTAEQRHAAGPTAGRLPALG
jgi:uncharacterized protein (TIGR03083 family)